MAYSYTLPSNRGYICNPTSSLTASDRLFVKKAGNRGFYGQTFNEIFGLQARAERLSSSDNIIDADKPVLIVSDTPLQGTEKYQELTITQSTIYLGPDAATALAAGPVPVKLFFSAFRVSYATNRALANGDTFTIVFQVQLLDPSSCGEATTVYTSGGASQEFWVNNGPPNSPTLASLPWVITMGPNPPNNYSTSSESVVPVTVNDASGLYFRGQWLQITVNATASATITKGTRLDLVTILYSVLP